MSLRAEFLAPPARTVPFRGPDGRTTNRSGAFDVAAPSAHEPVDVAARSASPRAKADGFVRPPARVRSIRSIMLTRVIAGRASARLRLLRAGAAPRVSR